MRAVLLTLALALGLTLPACSSGGWPRTKPGVDRQPPVIREPIPLSTRNKYLQQEQARVATQGLTTVEGAATR